MIAPSVPVAGVMLAGGRATRMGGRDKAFASGAHWVSTDYPEPRTEWSDYSVRLPGGLAARVNPVSGPPGKAADDIEKRPAKK